MPESEAGSWDMTISKTDCLKVEHGRRRLLWRTHFSKKDDFQWYKQSQKGKLSRGGRSVLEKLKEPLQSEALPREGMEQRADVRAWRREKAWQRSHGHAWGQTENSQGEMAMKRHGPRSTSISIRPFHTRAAWRDGEMFLPEESPCEMRVSKAMTRRRLKNEELNRC